MRREKPPSTSASDNPGLRKEVRCIMEREERSRIRNDVGMYAIAEIESDGKAS